MRQEVINKVKELIGQGKSHRYVASELKISTGSIYIILTGKKYNRKPTVIGIKVRGLSKEQKRQLGCIAKNKDQSQNRLLLSYIKSGINNESAQNKIYED